MAADHPTAKQRDGRPVTINDVARRAGLSVATVSRVMHDNPRVSESARLRVQQAVAALGYTPNGLARGLAMSNTRTIGVLVASISDPFWAEIVRGIEDAAHAERYSVLVASSYEDAEREHSALQLFHLKRVDGIVIGGSSGGPSAISPQILQRVPTVFINDEHLDPPKGDTPPSATGMTVGPFYTVRNDDQLSADQAISHLIKLGHRRIAYIAAHGRASTVRRLQGYWAALDRAGLPHDDSLVAEITQGANGGELAAFRLLTDPHPPTALFCYDDMTALGVLRAVRALRLSTPEQISVVGFDDIPIAAFIEPALTTVRQPIYDMGKQALALVIAALDGHLTTETITMPGELIVRLTTGPAPAPPI